MANLTRTSWPLGWTPSQHKDGNPDGLLRMDNLRQDKNGALTLVRGRQKLNATPFIDYVDNISSRQIGSKEFIWVSLNKETKSVLRSSDSFATSTEIIGITGQKTVFGNAFGKQLICSGAQRKKDDGTNVTNLGLQDPLTAAEITPLVPARNELTLWNVSGVTGSWSAEEYDDSIPIDIATTPPWTNLSAAIYPDPTTLRAVLLFTYDSPYDTTISGTAIEDPDWVIPNPKKYNPQEDTFRLLVQLDDSYSYTKLRVEFLLDGGENYYWYEWDVQSSAFKIGADQQSILNLKRKLFNRSGADSNLDWKTVIAVRFSATGISHKRILIGEQSFIGGEGYEAEGEFTYAYQYVADNGKYIAKSKLSPDSVSTGPIFNSRVQVIIPNQPVYDSQITEVWVYRRSVNSEGLNQYYRVAICPATIGGGFLAVRDGLSNNVIQLTNIKVNPYLVSVQSIPNIIGIEGIYNERILYLTKDSIYLSDRLNPDAVDSRYTIKLYADPSEFNLAIKVLTNRTIAVETTKDRYIITGTLLDLPDGTIDAQIDNVGEEYPPLCDKVALFDGALFYIAADGLRTSTGSNSVNVSPQLRLLFQGENCHGISAIQVESNNVNNYPIEVSQGKIYISVPHKDGSRGLIVYDTVLKIYRYQNTDPRSLYATFNDKLLAGYGSPVGNYIQHFDVGTTTDVGVGQSINLLTVFDHNNQPRNRKDTFTLKIVCNTYGGNIFVGIGKDGADLTGLGVTLNSGAAEQTFYIDISAYTLGFRYAITIQSNDLQGFDLLELTIEYEPRPEQVNRLRIPNTNLGSQARKRFTSYAFVIDTLGNDVTFTPNVDNVALSPTTVNKATKLTHKHFFLSETLGTDIGGILDSPADGPFEFYGLNLEEIISEKLPTAVKYLVIPGNDFGSPNRKRHTSYKFQINTRGYNVKFTPRIDGLSYSPETYNTTEKRTVEYFFDTALDITGVDIGGILETLENQEFEFYGVITPQDVELLPARLKSLYTPYTNFGTASKKRIRTIPLILDTRGSDVLYTPRVDGIDIGDTSVFNTNRKETVFHYFITDVFGIDFGGILSGENPFEFYGFGSPENVELLPVGKKYDQFQPLKFDKIGKLFELRVRLIATGNTVSIPYAIYGDEDTTHPIYSSTSKFQGSFPVVPNVDNVYTIQLPKNINSTIFRVTLGPTADPFHRYDMSIRVALSGMESDSKWFPIR